jgi:hypothetical protein
MLKSMLNSATVTTSWATVRKLREFGRRLKRVLLFPFQHPPYSSRGHSIKSIGHSAQHSELSSLFGVRTVMSTKRRKLGDPAGERRDNIFIELVVFEHTGRRPLTPDKR